MFEAFFNPTVIQVIDIVLSDAALSQLNSDGRTYVEGDVTVNGEAFSQVGIRLKGSSTYEDLECSDGYCKASFRIHLNGHQYLEDQKLGDLERITLNNMTSDYTQSKEVIVYDLLQQHSQLASRANYARVTLNGQPWGLYTNIESADDEWLKRRFDDPTGDFWGTGSAYGDFYAQYLDTGFVLKSGTGTMMQLEGITEIARELRRRLLRGAGAGHQHRPVPRALGVVRGSREVSEKKTVTRSSTTTYSSTPTPRMAGASRSLLGARTSRGTSTSPAGRRGTPPAPESATPARPMRPVWRSCAPASLRWRSTKNLT